VEFSHRALELLIEMGAGVVGVCASQASPPNADHCDLADLASEHSIPCLHVADINQPSALEWIRALQPDIVFCFGWSRLLRKPLLELAPMGVVGYHPSALPLNRGRHPLIWTLALGLASAGSTFFFMTEGADDGDIISQRLIPVSESDDAGSLYERMTQTALEQIMEFVPRIASGTILRVPQDEARANTWRKRGRADGEIDWRMSAHSVYNLVRALTRPYVGAHFVHKGEDVKVWRVAIVSEAPDNIEPGRVMWVDRDGATIKCGDRGVRLLETEPTFSPTLGEYV
jgi:methionyl-tRNA formyltransferase